MNRTYCGDCSNSRHGKIVNWLCNHYIKQELFRMPRLLSHIDEILYKHITNQHKFNRKIRRYYPYLPRSSDLLVRHEKLIDSSQRRSSRQRAISRSRARDIKYEAQIGIDLNHKIGLTPNAQETINMINENIKGVIDSINNVPNMINSVKGTLVARCTSFLTGFSCMLISIIRHQNMVDITLALTNFFSRYIESIDISTEYLSGAMEQVAEWVRSKEVKKETFFDAQIDDGEPPYGINGICDIIKRTVFHVFGVPKELFAFIRPHAGVIRDASMILTGTERIITFLLKYLQIIFEAISNYINPKKGTCPYLDYIEDVRLFVDPNSISKLKRDDMPSVVRRTIELYNSGLSLNKEVTKAVDPTRVAAFNKSFQIIASLLKVISPYFFADKLRISPYIICLSGGSGVGKSHLNQYIPSLLYSHPAVNVPIEYRNTTYTPGQDIYVRNFAQKYWDGYRNQRVVIFDDYLQMVETELIIESLNELIKVSNNNPYPLNMAEVSEKGCVRFTSDLVMITTNMQVTEQFLGNYVISPTAIMRRIHENIRVELKDKYRAINGTYNGPTDQFLPEAWDFYIGNSNEPVNLVELMDYLVPKFLAHQQKDHIMITAGDDCSYEALRARFGVPLQAQVDHGKIDHRNVLASMSTEEDDIPEIYDFSQEVWKILNGEEFKAQISVEGNLEELANLIRENYRNGKLLAILGLTWYEYNASEMWSAGSLARKRSKHLLKLFHPDKLSSEDQIKYEDVCKLLIYINILLSDRAYLRDIYNSKVFGPFDSYNCESLDTPPIGTYCETGPIHMLYNLRKREYAPKPLKFDDDEINRIFSEDGEYIPDVATEESCNRTYFLKYFTLRGIDIKAFYYDTFGISNDFKTHNDCYIGFVKSANRDWQYFRTALAYAGSLMIVNLGLGNQSVISFPRALSELGASIYESYSRSTMVGDFVSYVKEGFISDVKNILTSLRQYFGSFGDHVLVTSETYKFFIANGMANTYHCTAHAIGTLFSTMNYFLFYIPMFIFMLKGIHMLYKYFITRKVEDAQSESYNKKDSVKNNNCSTVISEAYAKKDPTVRINNIVTEAYNKKDSTSQHATIISELNNVIEAEGKYDINSLKSLKHFTAEISTDPNAVDLITGKIRNNLVLISNMLTDSEFFINGMFIGGKYMMTTYHLKETLEFRNITNVRIRGNVLELQSFNLMDNIVYENKGKDIIIVFVPPASQHPSLINHFYNDRELNHNMLSSRNGSLVTYASKPSTMWMKLADNIKVRGNAKYTLDFNGRSESKYTILNSWEYTSETCVGDCGGPLILHNKGVTAKILGMHVAGLNRTGIATPITKEFLVGVINSNNLVVPNIEIPLLRAQCAGLVTIEDTTQYLGDVASQYQFRVPSETKLQKSKFYGCFPSNKKPAHLTPFVGEDGKIINPMRMQIAKQFVNTIIIPQDIIEEASFNFKNKMMTLNSPYKEGGAKLLNERQTLNGIHGDDCVSPMNMKTSPGYPWTRIVTKPGKLDLVVGEPGDYLLKDEIREYVELIEDELSQGIIRPFLWGDCLKDEKRPIAKVDEGKTRVFNVGPFELIYLTKKYFGAFIAHLQYNKLSEVSVGINPHSNEWSYLYTELTTHKYDDEGKIRQNYLMCGDYSNYDKRLPYCLIEKALDIINDWYDDGESNKRVRESIFIATFNAIHICGRSVYRCTMGNPSGCAITAQINSLVNSLLARVVFCSLGREQNPPVPMSKFDDYIIYKSYGDDNLASVSVRAPWFNMKSFSSECAKYGIVYTTATKGDIEFDYVSWDDASYLKRSFKPDGKVWCWAPLEMESITEMIMWIKNTEMNENDILQSTFNSFTNELAHYEKSVYDEKIKVVLAKAYELNIPLVCDTYDTVRQSIRNGLVKE